MLVANPLFNPLFYFYADNADGNHMYVEDLYGIPVPYTSQPYTSQLSYRGGPHMKIQKDKALALLRERLKKHEAEQPAKRERDRLRRLEAVRERIQAAQAELATLTKRKARLSKKGYYEASWGQDSSRGYVAEELRRAITVLEMVSESDVELSGELHGISRLLFD